MIRFLLPLALASFVPPILVHQAPSGWMYDPACCAMHDCYQIRDDDVEAVTGGWLVKATNQVVPENQVKRSGDQHFHRCSIAGDPAAPTLCLYVPSGDI